MDNQQQSLEKRNVQRVGSLEVVRTVVAILIGLRCTLHSSEKMRETEMISFVESYAVH